jgi:hypothetical protein
MANGFAQRTCAECKAAIDLLALPPAGHKECLLLALDQGGADVGTSWLGRDPQTPVSRPCLRASRS